MSLEFKSTEWENSGNLVPTAVLLGIALLIGATRGGGLPPDHDATVDAKVSMNAGVGDAPERLSVEGEMPSLNGATGWLNSQPLKQRDLRGKVVVVGFWTYTCINWRRTEPYLRAWDKKYRNNGLVIIGVHSPEFEFEKKAENVRWAVHDMDIQYPVAIDTNFSIWRSFNNRYWPAVYIVDARGRIRYHAFGEGGYEKAETAIQQLLREAGHPDVDSQPAPVNAAGFEYPAAAVPRVAHSH